MKSCRTFGAEPTSLVLTEKAQQFYNGANPLTIREYDTERGYLYTFSLGGEPFSLPMTADQITRSLEELADELATA